ncbi:MAG: hypothetical protein PHR77_04725 [Kiritimatiellae bacterium]|nr:hypothetical protein [Kiritimatiellia bacterium]MDD5519468.1 hypothetical protein [Kiritimatiellia bacterium]
MKQPTIERNDVLMKQVSAFMNKHGTRPPLPHLIELVRQDGAIEKLHNSELQRQKRKNLATGFVEIIVSVSRREVEANSIGPLYGRLCEHLWDKDTVTVHCQQVQIVIDGYNEDTRELWEIPEVRDYILTLDRFFPYLFYFAAIPKKEHWHINSPFWLMIPLCTINADAAGVISGDLFGSFVKTHFAAMNEIFDHYHLDAADKDWNERMSSEILAFLKHAEQDV